MSNGQEPQAGQWWFSKDGSRVRVIGYMTDGRVCYENWGFAWTCDAEDFLNMRHEPDCTGFQWKRPLGHPFYDQGSSGITGPQLARLRAWPAGEDEVNGVISPVKSPVRGSKPDHRI